MRSAGSVAATVTIPALSVTSIYASAGSLRSGRAVSRGPPKDRCGAIYSPQHPQERHAHILVAIYILLTHAKFVAVNGVDFSTASVRRTLGRHSGRLLCKGRRGDMTRCERCVTEMNAVCADIYGSDGCPPCGHEAIDSAILREIAALKAEVASLRSVQLRQPAICPCFIAGARCVIQETTMLCYGKPCVLDRGKQPAGG